LMQIGSDSMGGHHIIGVSPPPLRFGYGVLNSHGEIDDESSSFSEGLQKILTHHWLWQEEDGEC